MPRVCNKCGLEKPATSDYFHRATGRPQGIRAVCKTCANKQGFKRRTTAGFDCRFLVDTPAHPPLEERHQGYSAPRDLAELKAMKKNLNNPIFPARVGDITEEHEKAWDTICHKAGSRITGTRT